MSNSNIKMKVGHFLDNRKVGIGIITLDIIIILFFLATSFYDSPNIVIHNLTFLFTALIFTEIVLRTIAAENRKRYFTRPLTIIDIIIVVAELVTLFSLNVFFLRIFRAMRTIPRFYYAVDTFIHINKHLRHKRRFIIHIVNFSLFIFVASGLIYTFQSHFFGIHNFLDSLYYTLTTITTTGYGDIIAITAFGKACTSVLLLVGAIFFLYFIEAILFPQAVDMTDEEYYNARFYRTATDAQKNDPTRKKL